MNFIVITSINEINPAIIAYANLSGWKVLIIGDRKSPNSMIHPNVDFVSIDEQKNLEYSILKYLPENHYCRKNIGYLLALENGAELLAETDDDNIPKHGWGENIFFKDCTLDSISNKKFINVYNFFTDKKIWPRGLPLTCVNDSSKDIVINEKSVNIGVWQGLADKDPDVDAIYRLTNDEVIIFHDEPKRIALDVGCYCPFNSQNTIWNQELAVLMYLPHSVTFRFTDILRGYIAQRIMWVHGWNLGFTEATVVQERNQHNLMADFEDELPMYLLIKKVVDVLDEINFCSDINNNLLMVYKRLNELDIVSDSEVISVNAWCNDINHINNKLNRII